MPAQMLPDWESFSRFERELRKLGFRAISVFEFRKQFDRLGLKAPRPRYGREIGFVFHANDLAVVVWTTWLWREGIARQEDTGWVLIADGDSALYFSHPLHRTKNFLKNLYRHAWIARWRALHRPLCPECKGYMRITRGRAMKSRYWSCRVVYHHRERRPIRLDWDLNLPPRARAYLDTLRHARAQYLKERRRKGKPVHRAMLTRRRWIRTRNVETTRAR